MLIDRISYRNSIKNINPIIKIFLAFIVLILILVTNNIELFIFNFIEKLLKNIILDKSSEVPMQSFIVDSRS